MTAGLLNTKGFQNLKYSIRSKGFYNILKHFYIPQFMKSPYSVSCQATDTNGVR